MAQKASEGSFGDCFVVWYWQGWPCDLLLSLLCGYLTVAPHASQKTQIYGQHPGRSGSAVLASRRHLYLSSFNSQRQSFFFAYFETKAYRFFKVLKRLVSRFALAYTSWHRGALNDPHSILIPIYCDNKLQGYPPELVSPLNVKIETICSTEGTDKISDQSLTPIILESFSKKQWGVNPGKSSNCALPKEHNRMFQTKYDCQVNRAFGKKFLQINIHRG